MKPEPYCEFDAETRRITFHHLPKDDEAAGRIAALRDRLARVKWQIAAKGGVSTRERREFTKEERELERALRQEKPSAPKPPVPAEETDRLEKIERATERKLQRLARRADRSQIKPA